ncbi:RNA pseudouridine synthase [Spirochaetia bacterium]|nr:RNA pseudouridine synthase [Spirochaetia bacterium]
MSSRAPDLYWPMPCTLRAAADDSGRRLDRILRKALPELPLSALHRFLRQGKILVDGRRGKAAELIQAGAEISLPDISAIHKDDDSSGGEKPENAPLPPVLFEGAGLLVFNKPVGMAVHGPESLDTLVQFYLKTRLPASLSFKPGPLHRLDKPTSGIVVFSTNLEGARRFSALLREGRVKKTYLALVQGQIRGSEVWEDALVRDHDLQKTFTGGRLQHKPPEKSQGMNIRRMNVRRALTRISPLASVPGFSLVRAEIETGRTHQIRAQAAAHGHPLAGDRKYGGSFQSGGLLLHAWMLETDEAAAEFPRGFPAITAPLPEAFRRRVEEIFGRHLGTEGFFP